MYRNTSGTDSAHRSRCYRLGLRAPQSLSLSLHVGRRDHNAALSHFLQLALHLLARPSRRVNVTVRLDGVHDALQDAHPLRAVVAGRPSTHLGTSSRTASDGSVGRDRTRRPPTRAYCGAYFRAHAPWGLNQTLLWARTTCTEVDQKCAFWVRFDTVLYH